MVTDKNVIDFLQHACGILLDLTEDNIKVISNDRELMTILKKTSTEFEKGYSDSVDSKTSLSPYHSMGWYLAASLRDDIQNYYRIKFGMTMAEFLKKGPGDVIEVPTYLHTKFNRELAKIEYKKYFGRELIFAHRKETV